MSSILSLQNVSKSYRVGDRDLPILKGINMEIERGEFVAIMGPSGSGKSTLLHLMGGLDRPTSGQIRIDNRELSSLDDRDLARVRNQSIGFVFQNFFLLTYYSAIDNVRLPLLYAGTETAHAERARHLLEKLGLGQRLEHRPNELSGGEKQRVAIARALINNPPLIFADEPTGALDTKNGEAIMDLFAEIHASGSTIVLITHDPHVAKRANYVLHIADGAFLDAY